MSKVNRKGIKSTGPSGEDSDSSSGMDIAVRNAEASVDSDSSSVDSCGLTNEELRHRSDMLLYEGHGGGPMVYILPLYLGKFGVCPRCGREPVLMQCLQDLVARRVSFLQ